MNYDLSKCKILIVDDIKSNIDLLAYTLKDSYNLYYVQNGEDALECALRDQPDLILLDIMMPQMDGYEVCARLKNDERTKDIPVIFITAVDEIEDKAKGFSLGAVDYITKPFDIVEVKARVTTHLSLKQAREALKDQNRILEEKVRERTDELYETRLEIIYRLGSAAEYRDNETGVHIKRMSHYCTQLGRAAGMNEEECEILFHASPMHDVGKIGIPDNILFKPGKLDMKEYEIMKKHTSIGGKILSDHNNNKYLHMAQVIALTHHERWDGSGYLQGLQNREIPLSGRIVGLCDVFDALVSDRPYKEAWLIEDAIAEIESRSGTHFDPYLVELFHKIIDEILEIRDRFCDSSSSLKYIS